MIKCPNCGSTAQVKSMWSNNSNTSSNHEYICGCGCHWVDRYEFIRRDIICSGTVSAKQNAKRVLNKWREEAKL
jgi:hypothetical protein